VRSTLLRLDAATLSGSRGEKAERGAEMEALAAAGYLSTSVEDYCRRLRHHEDDQIREGSDAVEAYRSLPIIRGNCCCALPVGLQKAKPANCSARFRVCMPSKPRKIHSRFPTERGNVQKRAKEKEDVCT
jgi:hypothetical protein